MKKLNASIVGGIIILFHLVGVVGYSTPQLRQYFFLLTPFNLLLSGVLLYIYHADKSLKFTITVALVGLVGFMVEVLGIHTGFPFGSYDYLTTLGFKLWGVPIVLAINWVLLIYCTADLALRVVEKGTWPLVLGALLMVGLDFLIEPVAIKYDYWIWLDGSIPVQNYVAWFVISFILHWFFKTRVGKVNNPIAPFIIAAQAIYFGLLNLL
jgi:uncharacterized membrane protein